MRPLSRWWILVVALAGVWIVSGCSGKREVTGQVFVVTKGGENVKLGLVGIHVIEERRLAEIAMPLLGKALTNKANTLLLKELAAEFNRLVEQAPPGFRAPVEELSKGVTRRIAAESLLAQSLEESLFKQLPPAVTQTDADGVFTVEASGADWLAARGQRRAGDSTEEYLWLIPLKEVQKKLLISNDRMLEDDDALMNVLQQVSPEVVRLGTSESLSAWVHEQQSAGKKALFEAKATEARALAEAKAKADAEERERQRIAAKAKAAEERALAEAKAKIEAAETTIAMKLGLSRPFGPGSRGQAGDVTVRWIPAGRFAMGSGRKENSPIFKEMLNEVVLTNWFFLAETECTQAQWEAVMGSNPSKFKGADRPVECVSWEQAVDYCRKLTMKHRAEGALPEGWEWRLPTEAEWEYAARAGMTGSRQEELNAIAWHGENAGGESHPVKQKAANRWGLYDMLGNVAEWCSQKPLSDPRLSSSGLYRGGGWHDDARIVDMALWFRFDPGFRHIPNHGFRPALGSVR